MPNGNFLSHFFNEYVDVGQKAVDTRNYINQHCSATNLNEIDIDVLLPFMLPISEHQQTEIATILGLMRSIIDQLNQKKIPDEALLDLAKKFSYKINIPSIEEYDLVNRSNRKYEKNDLTSSYLKSTGRVFYRIEILEALLDLPIETKTTIIETSRILSAFLLFDDDLYDIEQDLEDEKDSILIQYVNSGGGISQAIQEMTNMIRDTNLTSKKLKPFELFIEELVNVYIC